MITLHHLDNSRSQRVLWLMEELGLDYEVEFYKRDPKTMRAPEALRRVHPLGRSPVIVEDDEVMAETGAIIRYLLDRHGQGRLEPEAGTRAAREITYWLNYAEGSAMPPLLMKLVFDTMPQRAPRLMKPLVHRVIDPVRNGFVAPEIKLHIDYWEEVLGRSGWFVGDSFSAADIMMSFPLETASDRGGAGMRPVIRDFLKRIHSRPAYRRALEVGGPYRYA
ncbi:glutathione S-transferase family protein [Pseudooceanicola sp. LIPI14-2-Ac024]|uniref:glutathione S-transferase family protein n=1 Tax=Pseudooceanicola sp. LIPI14-2-Ac024 TaxID=3344875 RepID=UPI0035D0C886